MKKLISLIVALVVLYGAWYLISPVFRDVELNEPSPLAGSEEEYVEPNTTVRTEVMVVEKTDDSMMIGDDFDSMSEERMEEFKAEVDKMKGEVMEKAEAMPEGPKVVSEGAFNARAHEVAGKAILIEADGQKTLRFEDFETINGPRLKIYLATDLSASDYVDLGDIKATKGNVNYTVDASVDTDKYKHVLVWCEPFRVLFSYAELQ